MNRTVGSTLLSAALVCGLGLPAHAVGVPGTDPAEGAQGAPVQALAAPTPAAAAKLRPALGTGTRSPAVVYVQTDARGEARQRLLRTPDDQGRPCAAEAARPEGHGPGDSKHLEGPSAHAAPPRPTRPPRRATLHPRTTAPALTPPQAAPRSPHSAPDSRGPAVVLRPGEAGRHPGHGVLRRPDRSRSAHPAGGQRGSRSPGRWVRPPGRSCSPQRASSSSPGQRHPRRPPQAGADTQPAPPPAPPVPAALTPEQAAAARPLLQPRSPAPATRPSSSCSSTCGVARPPASSAGPDDQGGQGLPDRAWHCRSPAPWMPRPGRRS